MHGRGQGNDLQINEGLSCLYDKQIGPSIARLDDVYYIEDYLMYSASCLFGITVATVTTHLVELEGFRH
jgi:hypothetical protein